MLSQVNFQNKCYEYYSRGEGLANIDAYNFNSVVLKYSNISENDAKHLNSLGLYWGLFGVKDKWSIDNAITLNPKFVITDNIAYTNKVTN